MEKIQERALRLICDDLEFLLQGIRHKNAISPFHINKTKFLAWKVLKIVRNIASSYYHDLISLKPFTYDFRYEKQEQLPSASNTSIRFHKKLGLRSAYKKCYNQEFCYSENQTSPIQIAAL